MMGDRECPLQNLSQTSRPATPRPDPGSLLANDHDGRHDRFNWVYLCRVVSYAAGRLSPGVGRGLGLLAVHIRDDYRRLQHLLFGAGHNSTSETAVFVACISPRLS